MVDSRVQTPMLCNVLWLTTFCVPALIV